jgi:hypothetical protein
MLITASQGASDLEVVTSSPTVSSLLLVCVVVVVVVVVRVWCGVRWGACVAGIPELSPGDNNDPTSIICVLKIGYSTAYF